MSVKDGCEKNDSPSIIGLSEENMQCIITSGQDARGSRIQTSRARRVGPIPGVFHTD
jgi:hypothetical protein